MQPDVPQMIGSYRVVARLGSGGMGEVFLATSWSRWLVAVTVIRPELLSDPRWRAQFREQAPVAPCGC